MINDIKPIANRAMPAHITHMPPCVAESGMVAQDIYLPLKVKTVGSPLENGDEVLILISFTIRFIAADMSS